MTRYFIGLIVAIGLIILIVVLLFSGGDKKTPVIASKTLPSYANSSAEVRMTVYGPVTADQSHNEAQVTVGKDSTTFDLIQGYNDNVTSSKTFNNNENSYSALLYSLYYDGFSKGNNAANLKNNLGYCSVGTQYIFELIQNGKDIQRYWATNCGDIHGSYEGSLSPTISLFEAQIPNYGYLVNGANL